MLLEIASSKKDYFVVTSNVDGQFQKCGFDESKIDEVHGSIHYLQCINGCNEDIWSAKDIKIDIDNEAFRAKEPLAKCPHCKSIARPNILMFGDWGWIEKREQMQRENFIEFLSKVEPNNLAIIEFGAGVGIPTIRDMGESLAKEYNSDLIRVNPRENYGAKIRLDCGALDAIEQIYNNLDRR